MSGWEYQVRNQKLLNTTEFETYKEFLQSETWKRIREFIRFLHDNKCALCRSGKNIHVHHLRYTKSTFIGVSKYKMNRWLTVLCENCHAGVHELEKSTGLNIYQSTKEYKKRHYPRSSLVLTKRQVKEKTNPSDNKDSKTIEKQHKKKKGLSLKIVSRTGLPVSLHASIASSYNLKKSTLSPEYFIKWYEETKSVHQPQLYELYKKNKTSALAWVKTLSLRK